MRLIVIGDGLGKSVADSLRLPHILNDPSPVDRAELAVRAGGGFVLEGFPECVSQARALDETLRRHGADIDMVVWRKTEDLDLELDRVLDHYRGCIVEVEGGESNEETLQIALGGLREALIS